MQVPFVMLTEYSTIKQTTIFIKYPTELIDLSKKKHFPINTLFKQKTC